MSLFKLPRRPRYGNAGAAFNEGQPADDQYLFTTSNTSDLWGQLKGVSEQFGLDYYADASGDFVLKTRNNPHVMRKLLAQDFSTASTIQKHPNAYGGTYLGFTGTVSLATLTVNAARIDLIMPRGTSYGQWSVTVKQAGNTVAGPLTLDPSGTTALQYYDYRTTVDGTNATVTTLYSGYYNTYTIEFTSSGGTGGTVRYLDSLALWHTDPAKPLLPISLSTDTLALSADARSMMGEMRNHVIVVGSRNAAVTDSQKTETNPENPSYEFVVASGTDIGSIAQPFLSDGTTINSNYVGYPKESIIYDQQISDRDFAEYVARTFINRQRRPMPAALVEHTLLPDLQLKEAVYVVEKPYETLGTTTVQYVQSLRHSISMDSGIKALTSIETSPYPEFPSYERREDIDIDTYYNGSPVSDVVISYTGLSGTPKSNLAPGLVQDCGPVYTLTGQTVASEEISMANQPWPPMPGSVFIRKSSLSGTPTVKTLSFTDVRIGSAFMMYLPQAIGVPTVLTLTAFLGNNITSPFGTKTYNLLDPAVPFKWTYDPDLLTLSVTRKDSSTAWKFSLSVTYPKSPDLYSTDWQTNTPYQHLLEVSYANGTRKIALPWKVGDNGSNYTRPTGTYDVKYRAVAPDSSVLTSTGVFTNAQTVTCGGKTYTTQTALTNTDGNVLIGANAAATLQNLYDAINLTGTPGTQYATAMTKNTVVKAIAVTATTLAVAARVPGAAITTSETQTNALWASFQFTDPYLSSSPFYDPYTSELGNNVSINFSALVSGEYRITVRNRIDNTVVAYLTQAQADAQDKELHWQYLEAGTDKQYFWDGVDQVGDWNRRQSAEYADLAFGAFATDAPPLVGGGFYAWNREENDGNGTAKMALIAGERDANGKPIFGCGTYSEWYINFEVRNDTLELTNKPYPRVVRSDAMNWGSGAVYGVIYMHLPDPNKIEMSIADWKSSAYYQPGIAEIDYDSSWSSLVADNPDQIISNQKPVRIRFTAVDRPGTQWVGNKERVSFMLNRVVHLRYNLQDQFVVYTGATYPGTNVANRKIVNRRMSVDDHTIAFEDDAWRTAATLRETTGDTGLEWIFTPQDFKKNFRGIENESIKFGDYLQLEEVPQWDTSKSVASARSRLNIAFLTYLFYLSAYTQDRSGRYTWCLNRKFLDTSKIVNNTTSNTEWYNSASQDGTLVATQWPDDMNRQFRRTVVTRQWTNERVTTGTSTQYWYQQQAARWGFANGSIGFQLLGHYWKNHDPTSTQIRGPDGVTRLWSSLSGLYLDMVSDYSATNNKLSSAWLNFTRNLGDQTNTSLNTWTWESDPLWVPCISRDFHGYYLLPPMPDVTASNFRRTGPLYASVDPRVYDDDDDAENPNTGDDPAAAAVWNSPVTDYSDAVSGKRGFFIFRGKVVTPDKDPTKTVTASMCDYTREDSLVHFEDCRGIWSRGPRPAEQPRKVEPITPYYQNLYKYTDVITQHARQTKKQGLFSIVGSVMAMLNKFVTVGVLNPIPLYRATIGNRNSNWGNVVGHMFGIDDLPEQYTDGSGYHDMTFRGEYLWESGAFFPAKKYGRFWSKGYNARKVQVFPSTQLQGLYYDGGAWTGWKDDDATSTSLTWREGIGDNGENLDPSDVGFWGFLSIFHGRARNIFSSLYAPFAVGPKLATTTDMIAHMILVNERRAVELNA